jgi:hypothetical protein
MNPTLQTWGAGLAGAGALNVLHETARVTLPWGPHMDLIAMRGLDRVMRPLARQLSDQQLRALAFAGDLISNTLYYTALVGVGESLSRRGRAQALWWTAAGFGLGAGIGAVLLPPKMGLGQQPTPDFRKTAAITTAVYLAGALVAAAAFRRFSNPEIDRGEQTFSGF